MTFAMSKSVFARGVLDVYGSRADEQMIWVGTLAIVAPVADYVLWADGMTEKFKCNSVRSNLHVVAPD